MQTRLERARLAAANERRFDTKKRTLEPEKRREPVEFTLTTDGFPEYNMRDYDVVFVVGEKIDPNNMIHFVRELFENDEPKMKLPLVENVHTLNLKNIHIQGYFVRNVPFDIWKLLNWYANWVGAHAQ